MEYIALYAFSVYQIIYNYIKFIISELIFSLTNVYKDKNKFIL